MLKLKKMNLHLPSFRGNFVAVQACCPRSYTRALFRCCKEDSKQFPLSQVLSCPVLSCLVFSSYTRSHRPHCNRRGPCTCYHCRTFHTFESRGHIKCFCHTSTSSTCFLSSSGQSFSSTTQPPFSRIHANKYVLVQFSVLTSSIWGYLRGLASGGRTSRRSTCR